MNATSLEDRQEIVRRVLQGLAAAQAPALTVRLSTRVAEGPSGIRGFLNPSPQPAAAAPADESALPTPFREERMGTLSALRLGQELHVVVVAPAGGYLHLFNLGCSGDARRMLPRPGEAPTRLEPGRSFLASPSAGQAWLEKGPVNGFPERVLAIVTAESRPLPLSCLHPSWSDAALVRGFGTPVVDSLVSSWPTDSWSWGLAEAAVESA